jgi:general secretion pathway protein D
MGVLGAALLTLPWTSSFPRLSAAPGDGSAAGRASNSTISGSSVRVSGITIRSGQGGEAFVDVATSGVAQFHVSRLDNPRRLVVDVEGTRTTTLRGSYASGSSILKRVRVGQFRSENPPIVRVVADLHGNPAADVHLTPNGVRIELKPRGAMQPVVPMSEPLARPQAAQQPPQPTSQAVPPRPQMPPPNVPPSMPMAGPGVSPSVFYLESPLKSLPQNQKLLDTLGLRIALTLSYTKGTADEAPWKTKGLAGVQANRLFFKPLGGGNYRTVELAVTESPQRGYEIAVYGTQELSGSQGPNPDFSQLQVMVNEELTKMTQSPPPTTDLSELSYETYYLSYVAADRAVAMLKTLGYTTVEFNEQAGDSAYDKIYNPIKLGTGHPPVIVKLIDSTKTSLMEPPSTSPGAPGQPVAMPQATPQFGGFSASSAVPQIGGTFLQGMTSGEPQQRLLILYDKNDPDSLQSLLNLLQTTVDVPARQIMIEALVIELNADRTRQLGVTFETVHNNISDAGTANSLADPSSSGTFLPFQFTFTKGSPRISQFTATLQALLTKGDAQVLSNPSVLVLDDRQARIQIGQQIPVTQQLTSANGNIASASYFPVGIVLNLRPRINEDGSEITMQTETIVSSVNKSASTVLSGTIVAPTIDNRQVQSIVRVADNTPFIIGGLISTNDTTSMSGIPLLSQIPGLGALFRSTTVSKTKQEVIIVITPHVVPLEDKYFSYVIPKDSNQFDRLDRKLYRNAYRIRGEDLFDLEFVKDSNIYKQLVSRVKEASTADPELKKTEPFASILNGGAPGEDILVRRMLWGIIHRTGYDKYITPEHIILFKDNPSAVGGTGFDLGFLNRELSKVKDGQNTLALTLDAQPLGTADRSLVPPKATLNFENVSVQDFYETLAAGNARNADGTPKRWQVLLKKGEPPPGVLDANPLEVLQGALVLKQVLELNGNKLLTLQEFHIGRQIIFPSQEELQSRYHQVDREVARLFYEIYNYYPAFEQEFNRQTRQMNAQLDKLNHQQ